jgi:hypothetical protein
MMQLADELTDRAYQHIEPHAAGALTELTALLTQVADEDLRQKIKSAALTYSYRLSDAAIVLGYRMAQNPGAWLFQSAEPEK